MENCTVLTVELADVLEETALLYLQAAEAARHVASTTSRTQHEQRTRELYNSLGAAFGKGDDSSQRAKVAVVRLSLVYNAMLDKSEAEARDAFQVALVAENREAAQAGAALEAQVAADAALARSLADTEGIDV